MSYMFFRLFVNRFIVRKLTGRVSSLAGTSAA
jgi:hypothetical protein